MRAYRAGRATEAGILSRACSQVEHRGGWGHPVTVLLAAVFALGTAGCPPPPQIATEPNTRDVWGLRPGDLEACAQKMARDLIQEPLLRGGDPPVRIGIVSIENNTNEPFVGGSADMVLDRIQTILFRSLHHAGGSSGSTAKFITMRESVRAAMEKQRTAKRQGEATHRGLKDRHGVDYLLAGVYHALDKSTAGKRLVEMYMTFDLTDAESGESVWRHDYHIKTVTRR